MQYHYDNERKEFVKVEEYQPMQPAPSYGAPLPPGGGRQKKKRKGNTVALLLAVALISGGVGGAAGWLAAGGRAEMDSVQQVAQEESNDPEVMQLATETEENVAAESNTAAGSPDTNSVAEIAAKAGDSVVEITTEYLTTQPFVGEAVSEGGGSGVIYSEDGYIITNNHVVEDAQQIKVTLPDGTEYAAELIGRDEKTDLAVIKIDATGLTPAEFAESYELTVGELAVAIGNPLGELGGTVTSGIISATERDITIENESMTLIQTSAAVNPGNSGGGLFNSEGNLIGIVNAKLAGSEIEGLAFAIPVDVVQDVVTEIIENGYVTGRPQLGIQVIDVLDSNTAMMYRLNNTGAYVAVTAESLGLQAGDRILSIDGTEIASMQDITTLLEGRSVGDTVSMTVERNGQEVQVSLTLTEQQSSGLVQAGTENSSATLI